MVWSGQVGMVFACEDRDRIETLRAWLLELYAGVTERVVDLRR